MKIMEFSRVRVAGISDRRYNDSLNARSTSFLIALLIAKVWITSLASRWVSLEVTFLTASLAQSDFTSCRCDGAGFPGATPNINFITKIHLLGRYGYFHSGQCLVTKPRICKPKQNIASYEQLMTWRLSTDRPKRLFTLRILNLVEKFPRWASQQMSSVS